MTEERMARKNERKQERQAKIALEKKKLKDMKSFKDKKDYIWEYYKIPIISIISFIAIIFYVLNVTVFNPPDKTGVGLALTNAIFQNTDTLKLDIEEAINIEDGYEATITSFPLGLTEDITYEQAMQQKLYAMIVSGEIDLIVGVDEFFKQNSAGSMFFDLTQILTEGKYDSLKDKFVTGLVPIDMLEEGTFEESEIVEQTDEVKTILCVERPVAIRLDGCKILEDLDYPINEVSIGFISTGKRPDITLKLFDYIMGI